MTDLKKTVQDTAYIVVGLGVIVFQRAQVGRQELKKQLVAQRQQLENQMGEARTQVQKLVKDVEGRVQPLRTEVEQRITTIEELLPEQARVLVQQARKTFFPVMGSKAA